MAISVQWDNLSHTIIRWDFDATWTWDELADSAKVSSAMIASTDEDVDVILNAGDSHPPAGRITAYQRSAFAYTPSNIRMLVLVSGAQMGALQLVMPFFQQLEIIESLEEARALLDMQPA
jgi:hypothetical protein